ncbi:MAG: metalloregulator ArsR/SmtB family transcription factor [Chloroflexota bacterium]
MMQDQLFGQIKEATPQVTIALEPVYSILVTCSLLTMADSSAQIEAKLTEIAESLSAKQKFDNRLIFQGLGQAVMPEADYDDFPAYLDDLRTQSAKHLRDRIVSSISNDHQAVDHPEFQERLAQLLADPNAMQTLIVSHLQTIWEAFLAEYLEKRQADMRSMVIMLRDRDLVKDSVSETIRAFIGRDIPDEISLQLAGVKNIIFVPTPYIRLHACRFGSTDTVWIFVLADFWSLPLRDEPIKRSEALSPLRALADDSRLRILELLAAHDVLLAQEIIARVDISQPTVSRHLKQLVSAQIVTEERGPDANKLYRLNPKRIEHLYHTLRKLLSPENAQVIVNDIRLTLPPELRRFLDRQGLITVWPRKYKDKVVLMDYLIEKFEVGNDYTEPEINDTLSAWHTFDDAATLRRALFDRGLLNREGNGARYWREEPRRFGDVEPSS